MAKVDHFIVLMLENRSYDHMLGFLDHPDPSFGGLRGDELNRRNPDDATSEPVYVEPLAVATEPAHDPAHDFANVQRQLFGTPTPVEDPIAHNGGFVLDYLASAPSGADPRDVMRCHTPATLPVLSQLALEFAVCDRWFCSVPGPTWPNRLFAHSGASDGEHENEVRFYGQETIFGQLKRAGRTWRIYHDGLPLSYALPALWGSPGDDRFRAMDRFYRDAAAGDLPNYTFIEPRHFGAKSTSQHPSTGAGVLPGEELIAEIYNALRGSPVWNECVFLITYDEHGGFYDHVEPPPAIPPRAGQVASNGFRFDRYGVRVPAVVVSPYVARGTVDHAVYDHTSIIRTAREWFGFSGDLGAREANARSFADLLSLAAPRADTPRRIDAAPFAFPTGKVAQSDLEKSAVELGLKVLTEFDQRSAKQQKNLYAGPVPASVAASEPNCDLEQLAAEVDAAVSAMP